MKKGYMYALEGVIAGMLVVFYIGSMVQTPEQTSWDKTVLTQRAGDLISAISRTGILGEAIQKDDSRMVSVITSIVGGGVDYRIEVNDLPKSNIEVAVVRNGRKFNITGSTFQSDVTDVSSDDDAVRRGTYRGKDFVIVDSISDDVRNFDKVYFDFNGDNSYEGGEDLREGPFSAGDIFRACFKDEEPCSEKGYYQVAYVEDALGIFGLDDVGNLVKTNDMSSQGFDIGVSYKGEAVINRTVKNWEGSEMTISFSGYDLNVRREGSGVRFRRVEDFSTVYTEGDVVNLFGANYIVESVEPLTLVYAGSLDYDVLLSKDEGVGFYSYNEEKITDFLAGDNTLVLLENFSGISRERFDSSIMKTLDFDLNEAGLTKQDTSYNVFNPEKGTGPAGFINSFFYDNPISVSTENLDEDTPDKVDLENGEFYVNLVKDGTGSPDYIEFSKGSPDFTSPKIAYEGDRILLGNNYYSVNSIYPLEIQPMPQFKFGNYFAGKITGDKNILEVDRWKYNLSEGSTYLPYQNATFVQNDDAINGDYIEMSPDDYIGTPQTECDNAEYINGESDLESSDNKYPYKVNEGGSYSFIVTDIDCDNVVDYVNFDFNGDGTYNQTEEVFNGYSREGVYQSGEIVEMENRSYRVRFNSSHLLLGATGQLEVGTGVWSSDVYRGHGNAFYIGNKTVTDSFANLLQTVFMRAGVRRHEFTESKPLGSPNVGMVFSDYIEGKNYLPYTLETVWWFR